ncbi:MAG TPA: response regulator [Ruminiclostridium sp.]
MYKVLIIEDEEIVRNSLKDDINWYALGFKVAGAVSNGVEALETLSICRPHVILTDIRMPNMDGLELIEKVRQKGFDIEVIIISAYSEFDYAQKAIQFGAFAYLTKPMDEEKFNDTFINLNKKLIEKENMVTHLIEDDSSKSLANLQEAFLVSILSKKMDEEYIFLRLKELKIKMNEHCLCIGVIEIINNTGMDDDLEILKNSIQYWSLSYYPVVLFNQKIVVFKNSSDIFIIYDFYKDIDDFRNYILQSSNSGDIIINSGISSIKSGFGCLQYLYNEAVTALEFTFYNVEGTTISYGAMNHKIGKTLNTLEITNSTDRIIDSLMSLNTIEMTYNTNLFFDNILYISPAEIELIYMKCLEIFLTIGKNCREKGFVLPMQDNKNELYKEIKSCREIYSMKKWFTQRMINIVEKLELESRESSKSVVWKACKYIQTNIDKKLNLEEIAEYIHINPSYLSSIFKKTIGESLNNYINNCKIERAKEYLYNSEMSIQEVADRLGFLEYRYFDLVFKKRTGNTPLEFRKKKFMK